MQFSDRAEFCRRQLIASDVVDFKPNKKGIMQLAIKANVILKSLLGLEELGHHTVFYTEQDPKNRVQSEAQLVRMGLWRPSDVGWLWTTLPGNALCFLAKVTPNGKKDLNPGWITEKGRFIIDSDYPKNLAEQG